MQFAAQKPTARSEDDVVGVVREKMLDRRFACRKRAIAGQSMPEAQERLGHLSAGSKFDDARHTLTNERDALGHLPQLRLRPTQIDSNRISDVRKAMLERQFQASRARRHDLL